MKCVVFYYWSSRCCGYAVISQFGWITNSYFSIYLNRSRPCSRLKVRLVSGQNTDINASFNLRRVTRKQFPHETLRRGNRVTTAGETRCSWLSYCRCFGVGVLVLSAISKVPSVPPHQREGRRLCSRYQRTTRTKTESRRSFRSTFHPRSGGFQRPSKQTKSTKPRLGRQKTTITVISTRFCHFSWAVAQLSAILYTSKSTFYFRSMWPRTVATGGEEGLI